MTDSNKAVFAASTTPITVPDEAVFAAHSNDNGTYIVPQNVCPVCGATDNTPCVTKTGVFAKKNHAARA